MPKHKKKGPLSIQGAIKQVFRSDVSIPLKVAHRDSAAAGRGLPAYLHPSSIQQLCSNSAPDTQQQSSGSTLFLQLASGSDCVLHARASADVAPGCIQVDEVQQANLRLCSGEVYKFSVFQAEGSSPDDSDSEGGDADAMQGDTGAVAGEDEDSDVGATSAVFPFELTDVDLEVRLLHSSGAGQQQRQQHQVEVDAVQLGNAFSRQCCWRVLAANEYVVVELPGVPPLLLRVTATNTLTLKEQQDALGYHCFRGLLTPDTKVYITAAGNQTVAQPPPSVQQQQQETAQPTAGHTQTQQQLSQLCVTDAHSVVNGHPQQQAQAQAAEALLPAQSRVAAGGVSVLLVNAVSRAAAPSATNLVHVYTNDGDGGEWFPVKQQLLRPCIALTKAVRDSGDTTPAVSVDIDTLTFDRVLIFLEAQAVGRKPPRFAVHLLDDLQKAAEQLGLRSLQDYCSHLKGSRQAALGVYSFADVQRANASGKVWLLLDGMVLDVGRWLPEHPGGATIIPAQSLDCDCSRFFEMYHASRESFLYLQEFYIGELVPEDIPHVPLGGKQLPSADFLVQLREYTAFRQPMLQQLAQRIPVTHLGAGKRVVAGH